MYRVTDIDYIRPQDEQKMKLQYEDDIDILVRAVMGLRLCVCGWVRACVHVYVCVCGRKRVLRTSFSIKRG